MSLVTEARMLIALGRAEQLMDSGTSPGFALQQSARACSVDAAALTLLWSSKAIKCAAARQALQQPDGYDTARKAKDADA